MRLFKPKYEYIWTVAIDEFSVIPELEKDWNKIDALSDNKITTQYRKLKKQAQGLEQVLDTLTDRYNASPRGSEDSAELLCYMGQIIDVLKMQYFFIHALQEIINIRKAICCPKRVS